MGYEAIGTTGSASNAEFTSKKHPLMIDRCPVLLWIQCQECCFGFFGSVGRGTSEVKFVCYTKNVGVNGYTFHDAESVIKDNIGCFSSYSW